MNIPGEGNWNQISIKGVILGETQVGKSSLCQRFHQKQWDPMIASTISASCLRNELQIDGTEFVFCTWDTAGQERFRSVSPIYYRNAHIGILVIDLTQSSSLDVANSWVEELRSRGPIGMPLVVFGNKSDLNDRFQISSDTIRTFAESINAPYFQVSAFTGDNVDNAFTEAATLGLRYYKDQMQLHQSSPVAAAIEVDNIEKETGGSCC